MPCARFPNLYVGLKPEITKRERTLLTNGRRGVIQLVQMIQLNAVWPD